jgi:hypothetical protein
MTINIPQNNYVTPTECRQKVVQAICDAFLRACAWSSFTPYSEGRCRRATLLVLADRNNKFYGFSDEPFDSDKLHYRVRGCEMKAAFECLIKAGYHIFKKYKYKDSKYQSYYVCREPFMQDGQEVFNFDDIID